MVACRLNPRAFSCSNDCAATTTAPQPQTPTTACLSCAELSAQGWGCDRPLQRGLTQPEFHRRPPTYRLPLPLRPLPPTRVLPLRLAASNVRAVVEPVEANKPAADGAVRIEPALAMPATPRMREKNAAFISSFSCFDDMFTCQAYSQLPRLPVLTEFRPQAATSCPPAAPARHS